MKYLNKDDKKNMSFFSLIMITVGCKYKVYFPSLIHIFCSDDILMFIKHPKRLVMFPLDFSSPQYFLAERFCVEEV